MWFLSGKLCVWLCMELTLCVFSYFYSLFVALTVSEICGQTYCSLVCTLRTKWIGEQYRATGVFVVIFLVPPCFFSHWTFNHGLGLILIIPNHPKSLSGAVWIYFYPLSWYSWKADFHICVKTIDVDCCKPWESGFLTIRIYLTIIYF